MRYYLDMDKPVGHAAKLQKLASSKEIKRSVMYAKDGLYFYEKGVLYKHKLQLDDRTVKENKLHWAPNTLSCRHQATPGQDDIQIAT